MLSICFLLACLGTAPDPETRVSGGQELLDRAVRLVEVLETSWLMAGAIQQADADAAVFGGVVPLQIAIGPLSVAGGLLLATARVPRTGTHANFVARAHLRLSSRLSLFVFHVSNGSLWGSGNPAMDAIGLSVRLDR